MSLWCLVTAPLILSGDMARLDDFTLGLLCNDEVLEVDQDPLGQAAGGWRSRATSKFGPRTWKMAARPWGSSIWMPTRRPRPS